MRYQWLIFTTLPFNAILPNLLFKFAFFLLAYITGHKRCAIRLKTFQNSSRPRAYKTGVQSQTQNKAQWLAACGHVSACSQSLRFILSLRMNSSFITSTPGVFVLGLEAEFLNFFIWRWLWPFSAYYGVMVILITHGLVDKLSC